MLKVLLIGCGNIAGGFDCGRPVGAPPLTHAGAYTSHGGFELVACVEPDEARRSAFMQRWGVASGYAARRGLLDSQDIFDIVSICSPTSSHHHDVLAALQLRPRLIFCEKPLSSDMAQAQHMVDCCQAQGVLLAVNHNRRWDAAVTRVRDELTAGTWGALRCAVGYYNKGVRNNGSHMIDLLQNLLGPLTLLDVGTPMHDFWPDDPSVSAQFVTPGGVPVNLHCGHAADYALFELQLVLERGLVAMEDGGLQWRVRHAGPSAQFAGYQSLVDEQKAPGNYLDTMTNAITNIHAALTHGIALASTGETALAAQKLCESILQQALRPKSGENPHA
jgi:predicted dehydrogenase